MKKLLFIFVFLICTNNFLHARFSYDLTIIGPADFNDGLGRISIGIIDNLQKDLRINYISSRNTFYERGLSKDTLQIIKGLDKKIGKVIIFTDSLNNNEVLNKLNINKDSKQIKLAYSMFESSKIPKFWVEQVNHYFDAVIVPDDYLVNVYLDSGIEKPIFVLPLGLYLTEFLNFKRESKNDAQFRFGCLSNFDLRKNQKLLIKAFVKEFGNNKNVILKINGRSFNYNNLNKYIKNLKQNNIFLTNWNMSWKDYIEFMSTLDCYVNISKGEGFSIPPREALAMNIPCILTNNTAQITICRTGFVKSIECDILEQAKFHIGVYDNLENVGFFFNCKIDNVRKALRDIYENYSEYQKKAKLGKKWVKQYSWQNLKNKYLNLFNPKKIILGNHNQINDQYIITNSSNLYNKYLSLIN